MVRGRNAKVGDTRVSNNGYHYTKCEEGWRLTHHLVAEKHVVKRKLEPDERVSFFDNDRTNLSPDNIIVKKMGTGSLQRRKGQLEARIQELQAELEDVLDQIALEQQAKTSK